MNESTCEVRSYEYSEESNLRKQLRAEMAVSELYNSGRITLSQAKLLYGASLEEAGSEVNK